MAFFDVSSIALNMKRKLAAEGGGDNYDPYKKFKPGGEVEEAGAGEDDPEELEDEDLLALAADQDQAIPDDMNLEDILDMVDNAPEIAELDETSLRAMVNRLEKNTNANVQMRIKYPSQPEKFMDSEVALDEAIAGLLPLAASPELYGAFVKANGLQSLLTLIPHENTDIGISVVNVLHDLFDVENVMEDEESFSLVEAFLAANGPNILVDNLFRLDDLNNNSDATCVFNAMEIFENLCEVQPVAVKSLCHDTKLLTFIFEKVKKEGFDQNKLYVSEILSIVLQTGDDSVRQLFGVGAQPHLITLLKAIAKYRRRDPTGNEETEYLENLYNSLNYVLHENVDNQVRFGKAEGFQLMLAVIRKKKYAKHGALKAMDFAITNCAPNCEKFIESSGLKVIFAIMMKRKKKKDRKFEIQKDEHVTNILVQLFLNLADVHYLRLLKKFMENEYQKIERLVELFLKYTETLAEAEAQYKKDHPLHLRPKRSKKLKKDEDHTTIDSEEEEEYQRKLPNGLFVLQNIALLIGFVATAGDKKLNQRAAQLLTQHDRTLSDVRSVLLTHGRHVEPSAQDESDATKNSKLLSVLGGIIATL